MTLNSKKILLKNLNNELKGHWGNHLKEIGVIFPTGSHLNALLCLYYHMPGPVSQQEMINWHNEMGLPEYGRQARHLTDLGWDIRSGNNRFTRGIFDKNLKRDQLRLHSFEAPNPKWASFAERRSGTVSVDEWNIILERFKDRGCAVCGEIMEHYDKGHLSRDKGYTVDNIVPMCSECNNWGQEMDFKLHRRLVARPLIKYFLKRGSLGEGI